MLHPVSSIQGMKSMTICKELSKMLHPVALEAREWGEVCGFWTRLSVRTCIILINKFVQAQLQEGLSLTCLTLTPIRRKRNMMILLGIIRFVPLIQCDDSPWLIPCCHPEKAFYVYCFCFVWWWVCVCFLVCFSLMLQWVNTLSSFCLQTLLQILKHFGKALHPEMLSFISSP